MARLWRFLREDVWRLEPEGEKETPETRVVSDGVKGVSVEAETLVQRERVRQLTAEQVGDVPQFREETVDEESPVPCERVQQFTAEKIWNVPRVAVKEQCHGHLYNSRKACW